MNTEHAGIEKADRLFRNLLLRFAGPIILARIVPDIGPQRAAIELSLDQHAKDF
jgi:hypothetical protein